MRGSDFIQISLISGDTEMLSALQLGENVPGSSTVLYALSFCSERPIISRMVRTVDGGTERNSEYHNHRT